MNLSRSELRSQMRLRRRALSVAQRRRAANAALAHFLGFTRLPRGLHLAVYLPAGGELDTAPLIALARRRGCHIYVPVVRAARKSLKFMPLAGPLRRNCFGILEPRFSAQRCRHPRQLDLVLVPLLAFGPRGERLGSGAGFYDQTFAFLRHPRPWRKPKLIGYAYHWQFSPALSREVWDVPLTAVVTDHAAICMRHC